MKTIKIKFVDFWSGFDPMSSFFYEILQKRYIVELSDNPQYLFYSVFGDENLKYNCIKIFYTGENQSPDFNLTDYSIGFDDISFSDRHFRLPLYYLYPEDFKAMMEKTDVDESIIDDKQNFCSFVYSNNDAWEERGRLFDILDKYKAVSSGGKYRNNIGKPVEDKNAFQSLCKFSIACENSGQDGYVTEKIVQSYAAKTIPIYLGDPSISKTFNPESFIDVRSFHSEEELIARIKEIDSDNALFLKMLQTPALLHPESDDIKHKTEEFIAFLYHIFDQDEVLAIRYCRIFRGEMYLKKRLYESILGRIIPLKFIKKLSLLYNRILLSKNPPPSNSFFRQD